MDYLTIATAVVQALAALVLVGVTWWYAKTTARVLSAMEKQAAAIQQQNYLISLAAEIQGYAADPSHKTWLSNAVQEMAQYRKRQWPKPPEPEPPPHS